MFQNPWAKGGEYYPEEVLASKSLLNKRSIENILDNQIENVSNANTVYDYQKKWFKKVGYELLKLNISKEGKFSTLGMLVCISHANNENSWGQLTGSGQIPWSEFNWWNFGYLKSRNQSSGWKNSHTRFASFKSLEEAFVAYIDRITSTPDIVQFNNSNFNPSYPALGNINTRNVVRIPTKQEILEACRIKINKDALYFPTITGNHIKAVDSFNSDNPGQNLAYECYLYCGDCGEKYATDWISIIKKNKDIFRICLTELTGAAFQEMSKKILDIFKKDLKTHSDYENWLVSLGNYFGDEKYNKCKAQIDEYDTVYSLKYSYNNDLLWHEDT